MTAAVASLEPLALAFANTLRSDRPGRDALETQAQADEWLGQQGLSGAASAAIGELRALRAAVRTLFDAEARGNPLDPEAIGIVNAAASRGPVLRTLDLRPGSLRIRETVVAEGSVEVALATIAASVVELLGGDHERVAACQGRGCRLYFIGGRRTRRWCSSAVCGNRARVAAYAARHPRSEPGRS